ncbi:MAG: uracil-DNA glycosylase [Anaerolineaceae bacterium]|nr:uracil-DNA glycosylase [Anaerolineaceae bacterium]MCB9102579.1 uracil-DNA glycosylase [Anaerolineales bacterium]
MPNDREVQLEILADAVRQLEESPLYTYRTENNYAAVFGEGDSQARIMVIGEAPGEQEAKQGRPFVGSAGKVLNDLLELIGLQREDIYITNIVKDRPPDNRNPRVGEIKLYAPFLVQQIEIIQPKVIAPLGRFAMEFILKQFDVFEKQKISQVHGTVIKAQAAYGEIAIVPLYHPAAAFYNPTLQETLREDILTLRQFVA